MSHTLQMLFARIVGLLGTALLVLVYFFPNWWIIMSAVLLWIVFLLLFEFFVLQKVAPSNVLLLLSTFISCMFLLYIMNRIMVAGVPIFHVGILGLSLVFFQLLLTERPLVRQFHYLFKPLRRVKTMVSIFDIFAIATFGFALHMLMQIPFWMTTLISALLTSMYFVFIWRMYFSVSVKSFLLWTLLSSIIMIQLSYVLVTLPFGYQMSGLIFAWVAYMLQLILRFELSKQGLDLKKQLPFFVTNALMFVLTLVFYVAWV